MPRPDQAAKDARAWRRITDDHAATVVRAAINAAVVAGVQHIDGSPDEGGHVVAVEGPDGVWRRYFLRLTECK